MQHIRNIVRIAATEASNLSAILYPAPGICHIPANVEFTPIGCKSPSSLEITDKVESKVRIFTAKLSFKSADDLADGGKPLAYMVTTAMGERYLIGGYQRPYPVITRSEVMPSSLTDTSLIAYSVSWQGVVKPLRVV